MWSAVQQRLHINLLEMEAVRLALLAFLPSLRRSHVPLRTGNTSVACYLNRQGGSAVALSLHSGGGYPAVVFQGGDRHIGTTCLRVAKCAGRRSRQKRSSQVHRLDPGQGGSLTSVGGLVRADGRPFCLSILSSTADYVSSAHVSEDWAVDALSIPWTDLLGYAFPPFAIISKVIRKARLEGARLILIAPWWPSQPWFPELLSLSHESAIPLVLGPRSLLQPRSGVPHSNPQVLSLHAWLLCGRHRLHKAPLAQC